MIAFGAAEAAPHRTQVVGILRLYLALCVIGNHAEPVLPWRMHGGPDAVQIFFVISGFYMQWILGSGKYGTTVDFFLSRWLRIFVPYVVALAAVVVASVVAGWWTGDFLTLSTTLNPEGNGRFGTNLALLTNATIFFQDWIMFLGHEAGAPLRFSADFRTDAHPLVRFLWIPPAWSVAVELTFYLLAPLLACRLRAAAVVGVMALSLAGRWLCASQFGLDHDPWTYRFMPFELFSFCLGMLACRLMRRHTAAFDRLAHAAERLGTLLGGLAVPVLAMLVLASTSLHLMFTAVVRRSLDQVMAPGSATLAVLAGTASLAAWGLFVPVVFSMTRRNPLDRMIGELSYPVYLLHYTVMLLVTPAWVACELPESLRGEAVALVTVATALLMQVILLGPLEAWRQWFVSSRAGRPTD